MTDYYDCDCYLGGGVVNRAVGRLPNARCGLLAGVGGQQMRRFQEVTGF